MNDLAAELVSELAGELGERCEVCGRTTMVIVVLGGVRRCVPCTLREEGERETANGANQANHERNDDGQGVAGAASAECGVRSGD